jgi:hypothetical protein
MANYPQISKAGKWDITIQQGSTYTRNITFTDFDISEFKFRGMVKRQHRDRTARAAWNVVIVANNEIKCTLTHLQSAVLPIGHLVHDIEMYYEEDNKIIWVARILEGKIKVTAEVTT